MKRAVSVLIIIIVFIFAVSILIKPLILFIAERELGKIFIGSEVSLGACSLEPARRLAFKDIEIKKGEIYDFKVKEVGVQYNIFSLFKKNISKFYLRDAVVSAKLPQNGVLELKKYLNLGSSRSMFLLNNLEFSHFNLNLESNGIVIHSVFSFEVNLPEQLFNYIDIKIGSLEGAGFKIKDAYLEAKAGLAPGDFFVGSMQYNKAKIEEIKSMARLEGNSLSLESLSAKVLGGKLEGNLLFKIVKNIEYSAKLKFIDLDLNALVNDFNLKERFQMTGRLGGNLSLSGSNAKINILNGDFLTFEPGGTLEIKESNFLEKMARSSGQALDIVVESFKNYRYNNGIMKLDLDKGNLILDVGLEGLRGKRNFNIIIHNFDSRKELP